MPVGAPVDRGRRTAASAEVLSAHPFRRNHAGSFAEALSVAGRTDSTRGGPGPMKTEWLQHTVLRAASLLAPGDQRAEWVKEWRSELWYIPQRQAMRFSLGAFRDALWLRRNNLSPATRPRIRLESPLRCLAFLSTLAAVSIFTVICLPAPHLEPSYPLTVRNLPEA